MANMERVNEKISQYGDALLLRAAVSNLPWIGSTLDMILSSKAQKFTEERIMKLLSDLELELAKVDEEKIDKDYLDSEEFYDLMMNAFRATVKTRSEAKIRTYALILKSSLTYKAKTVPPENYLFAIEQLGDLDLFIANAIYNQQKDIVLHNINGIIDEKVDDSVEPDLSVIKKAGWDQLPETCGLGFDDLIFHFKRIENVGLISEVTGAYLGYGGGVYRITKAFKRLKNFIHDEY